MIVGFSSSIVQEHNNGFERILQTLHPLVCRQRAQHALGVMVVVVPLIFIISSPSQSWFSPKPHPVLRMKDAVLDIIVDSETEPIADQMVKVAKKNNEDTTRAVAILYYEYQQS